MIRSILACAVALVAAIVSWRNAPSIRDRSSHVDELRAHEMALRPAIAALPPGAIVGYVSDRPVADIDSAARLFATQYLLAPRLVIPLDQPRRRRVDVVIGYFVAGVDQDRLMRENRLRNRRELSPRVVLFDP